MAHIGSGAPAAHAAAARALRDAIGSARDALVFSALAEEYGRLVFPSIDDVDVAAGVLTGGVPVPPGLGWDALTVLRKATGRLPLTGDEYAELARAGIGRLAFGG